MTDYIINKYGLNEKISDVLPIILIIGLPVTIFLAWYFSDEKVEGEEKAPNSVADNKSPGFALYMVRTRRWS